MKGKFKVSGKKVVILVILFICLLIGIGIDYCLFKPSKVNKYIASNIYKTPANSAFKDDRFYQCVVDNYNIKNDPDVPYTTNLSDSQLNSIYSLDCENKG